MYIDVGEAGRHHVTTPSCMFANYEILLPFYVSAENPHQKRNNNCLLSAKKKEEETNTAQNVVIAMLRF